MVVNDIITNFKFIFNGRKEIRDASNLLIEQKEVLSAITKEERQAISVKNKLLAAEKRLLRQREATNRALVKARRGVSAPGEIGGLISRRRATRAGLTDIRGNIAEQESIVGTIAAKKKLNEQTVKGSKANITALKDQKSFKGEMLSLMFATQMLTQGFTELIKSTLDSTGITGLLGTVFQSILLPVLMPVILLMAKFAKGLSEASPTVKRIVSAIIIFIGVLGPILILAAGLALLFSVGIPLAFIAAGAAIVAIGATIVAFFEPLKELGRQIKEGAIRTFEEFRDQLVVFIAKMKVVGKDIIEFLITPFENVISTIKDVIKWVKDLKDAFQDGVAGDFLKDTVTSKWETFKEKIGFKQFGGVIKQSGAYYLHAGETVSSNSPGGFQSGGGNNFNITVNASVSNGFDVREIGRELEAYFAERLI